MFFSREITSRLLQTSHKDRVHMNTEHIEKRLFHRSLDLSLGKFQAEISLFGFPMNSDNSCLIGYQ